MMAGSIFFGFCTLVCLVGALSTVLAKNPIRSAVGLLATILGIAGLYLLLEAQFLAAIQLIVYAGAVVVLFVFVIMILGPDARGRPADVPRTSIVRTVAGVLGALMAALFLAAAAFTAEEPAAFNKLPADSDHGSAMAVGRLLFSEGLVSFEVATALLIVAVVGAVAVARSRGIGPKKPLPPAQPESSTERLLGGPVEPSTRPVSPTQEATR